MDKLLPISVFIITRDEADRIARTIQAALRLTSDIVVVDSGSTDGTREIAQKLGARVVHNEWPGYGAQKNFAQELCNHDWVLNLDADEVLSDELISEIRSLFDGAGPQADAYRIRIVDVIPGETSVRRFAYAFDPVRLYRKECGRFSLSTVHDRVQLHPDAVQSQLRGKVQHFSMRGIGAQLAKFNEYTDAQVDDIIARGGRFYSWRIFTEFPVAFLKAWLIRRHFIGGRYGFLVAMNYAIFRHLRVAKYHERRMLGTHCKKPAVGYRDAACRDAGRCPTSMHEHQCRDSEKA